MKCIDAGKSRRGWSRISRTILCEYLAGAIELGASTGNRDPLNKGTLGHLGQAHLHLHEGVLKGPVLVNGVMVDAAASADYYDAKMAMTKLAFAEPEIRPFLEDLLVIHDGYLACRKQGVGDAVMIEQELVGVIGTCKGSWGLHLVADDQWDLLDPQRDEDGRVIPESVPSQLRHFDGSTIDLTLTNVPGAKDHLAPIYISRRLDLVRRKGRYGQFIVEDHKFKGRLAGGSSTAAYRADDGFTAIEILGQQRFGHEFGGIVLNLISTNMAEPGKQKRVRLPPAQGATEHFPNTLYWHETKHAQLRHLADIGAMPRSRWPRRMSENGANCVSRYGKCALIDHCTYGSPMVMETKFKP